VKATRPAGTAGQPPSDGNPDRAPDAAPSRLRGIPPLSRLTGAQLTGAERRLAEILSRRYPEAALLSARSMADAAGTSPASVTRFAQKLGYAGFAELQTELAVEMRARLNSPPKRLTVDAQGRRKPAGALLRDVIARERENLDATVNMIDESQLEVLARRLAHNTKSVVYVAGSKKAGIVAAYFAMQLAQLRQGVSPGARPRPWSSCLPKPGPWEPRWRLSPTSTHLTSSPRPTSCSARRSTRSACSTPTRRCSRCATPYSRQSCSTYRTRCEPARSGLRSSTPDSPPGTASTA
jgi:Helix-turn-helix domain, rpiR family